MKLMDVKRQRGLTNELIAQQIGAILGEPITREKVRRHVNEETLPSKNEYNAYFVWSGGLVTPNDFCNLPPADAPAMQGAEVAG
ncbi:MAG: hypothetical protein WBK91_04020 [Alphaproteobacteria bacterium]